MGVKVRERPQESGIWWVFIDHQGNRKSKKIGKDKKLANDVAKKIEARLVLGDTGIFDSKKPKVPTLKEYLKGWKDSEEYYPGWLQTVAKMSLKNSTRISYEHIIENHIMPSFGKKRLHDIDSRMINSLIYKLFKRGLRSGTIKNIKNCMSAILRHAKQENYISTNPATGLLIPVPEDEKPSREPLPFSWDERDHFEKTVKIHFHRYYSLVVCGFRTGLRIGELIALKWDDIDFHNRLIFVQRNVTRGKVTTPKSRAGKRSVRMTNQLVQVLKAQRIRIKEEKLKKGWSEIPEWVFCSENGDFIAYSTFVRLIWNKAMEKSGLAKRTPHDMRHTYATLRLSKGDSLAEVSKEMGHGSPEITFRTYYKWMPKESRSNIDELDGKFEEKTHPSATYPQPETEKGLTGSANPL